MKRSSSEMPPPICRSGPGRDHHLLWAEWLRAQGHSYKSGFGVVGVFLLACTLLAASASTFAQDQTPETASGRLEKQSVTFQREGVAAANPIAVKAGFAMLKKGGTAVDAMIATQLMLGLVEPQSSGLGGGAFLLVHDGKRKKLTTYDARETAPAAAKPDRFIGSDGLPMQMSDAVIGGKSVGVPGTVA